jgi:hypothetical protein
MARQDGPKPRFAVNLSKAKRQRINPVPDIAAKWLKKGPSYRDWSDKVRAFVCQSTDVTSD